MGYYDSPYVRLVHCYYCGKGFKDDCGDTFCSERCERQYQADEMEQCEDCGDKFHHDDLQSGICENCWEDREREDDEE